MEKDIVNSINNFSINCTYLNPCTSSTICICLPDLSCLQKFYETSFILEERNYSTTINEFVVESQLNIDLSHSENRKVINNFDNLEEANYLMSSNENLGKPILSRFLAEKNGILNKIGLSKQNLTTKKNLMYRIPRNTISKLRNVVQRERDTIKTLRDLYNNGKFNFIEENLNVVTKKIINSQLKKQVRGQKVEDMAKTTKFSHYLVTNEVQPYIDTCVRLFLYLQRELWKYMPTVKKNLDKLILKNT